MILSTCQILQVIRTTMNQEYFEMSFKLNFNSFQEIKDRIFLVDCYILQMG